MKYLVSFRPNVEHATTGQPSDFRSERSRSWRSNDSA